ncbi:MAG: sugar phosphate isomerase/epimerase, partial [Gammaproteobacteria bacterium]|nr:sugar phosphate isomerase/epimerase [Gammaproteobacteria bacterium]
MDFSYQLYSSRNFQPWENIFTMLREAGYKQVEGIGALYEDPDKTRASLDQNGLTMPTGHFALDMLENESGRVLEIAATLNMKAVYCPFLLPDQRPDTAAGYVEFGQRLEKAGKACVDAGLKFGWHNHDFEFHKLEDGSYPMDRIFEGGPSLGWEADLAWVARGGCDPQEWVERHSSRISAVHVKDIASAGECTDEDGWADVGHGTLDWKGLMQATRNTPAEYF